MELQQTRQEFHIYAINMSDMLVNEPKTIKAYIPEGTIFMKKHERKPLKVNPSILDFLEHRVFGVNEMV